MHSFQFLLILLSIFSIFPVNGLECYYGASLQDSKYQPPQNNTETCLGEDAKCVKTTTDSDLLKAASFGCDDDGLICLARGIKAGSCKSEKNTNMCCCDTNLCNFSPNSRIFSVFFLFSMFIFV